jgi:oxepin-CoA hydrolase / 3-oxo-5,6-dehydrosuberyl-CoA semialdehyde dehydrogenase
MTIITVQNFAEGRWITGEGELTAVQSAVTGTDIARLGSSGLNFAAMLDYARTKGGPALRAMTFHERANILKSLAQAIMARKEELYTLSGESGATRADSGVDIEGGAGTFFAYAGKGKRELPNQRILIDGDFEPIGKTGKFAGLHVYTPMQGAAVHINAFNFPIWGMLEKLAPALLAGVPAIVKPAAATSYLAEAAFRILIETSLLPDGAIQLISGKTGDLFDHLTGQDTVAFTGSAGTAQLLQRHPVIARESVRFTAERDSLNASILGPDATPETPEFDLYIKEVAREMTVKAGQKCTAIRRIIVPAAQIDAVQEALSVRLAKASVGDPRLETTRMGALVSRAQLADVREKIALLAQEARIVFGDPAAPGIASGEFADGAFMAPVLLRTDTPWETPSVHEIEAFGPVATLMPYGDIDEAIRLANAGKGSLALSVFSASNAVARDVVMGSGAFHGRIILINRDSAPESTGHGSPLPMLVHGGPGRAGGGEELGGIRGVKHYMQRSALQGHPSTLSAIVDEYLPGAETIAADQHPFRKRFGDVAIGYTLQTAARTVTLEDIEHFAHFTGDTFYAHMDEVAAAQNPLFGGRVAHGYLILSFAAGLFVDPAPGPVLANYGLEGLRFVKPLKPGDAMKAALTVKSKSQRNAETGEVKWAVRVTNQDDELVATYDLLTMNAV